AKGLRLVASMDEVPIGGAAMIRAHGAGPATYEAAEGRRVTLIDATCPFVRRAQRAAADLAEEGYQVLVVGERDHPEARGIVEHTGGRATVVEDPAEVDSLPLKNRVGMVAQTTQAADKFLDVIGRVLPRVRDVKIANTICDATSQRQTAALEVARQVDVMLVIGGRHSANTTRLADLCSSIGTPTYHIESAEEIEPAWLVGATCVGVTGGASTPVSAIEETVNRIESLAG
ncbi:MAG: 4-hydroxy-3-methylbut-2-enyl diphosphate reductase, partial [Armatimonadetes bacterium]|nr:4-hydroxy-3-methylbut-2-enyl diphosphate reductase [Armatimonadota bacterium]